MKKFIGIDIGGTKCAVVLGDANANILKKIKFDTTTCEQTLKNIFLATEELFDGEVVGIGVSCGGPLDSKNGIIMSPPNLPGWDNIKIVSMLSERFGVPAYLQNDADACAIAEWMFGAGKGTNNMIFLTFGTGMGAGLILNGKLYSGACDMAGEVGHIRLYDDGHIGYGKRGSFEGYCSGGGIAQYGMGSARELAEKARGGDGQAIKIFKEVGTNLGKGVAILIDILNPEMIVIGSIYARAKDLLEDTFVETLNKECLKRSIDAVKIVPAKLGEAIGDMAALGVAINNFRES
jgi:glucokinase